MGLADPSRSILVAVDFQGRLMDLVYRHETLVDDVARAFRLADLFAVPIVVTEQYPKGLGPTVPALQDVLDDLETPVRTIEKTTFSCCGEPTFLAALDELRGSPERQVIVIGIEAQICVVQTVLELLDRGDSVLVCSEAVTGRGPEARHWALERMRQAGAQVLSLESIAFEWTRSKNHEAFKSVSGLFKGVELP
ncbi:MAG: isochorismatase family protein [Acidobacteriota bacterium]